MKKKKPIIVEIMEIPRGKIYYIPKGGLKILKIPQSLNDKVWEKKK